MDNKFEFSKKALLALPLPAAGQRANYYDMNVPKLAVRVTAAGTKTFYVIRRTGAEMVWFKLGVFNDMTVEQAGEFFENIPKINRKVKILNEVGLGYITLGQHATTLSGGEAQRVKLSEELSKKDTGKTIYILDEPTTGLHFKDIQKLLEVLQKLADKGNTVLIIEHNLDVIKVADHVIDVGPEGGNKGGTIVAEGTPEQVAKIKGSYTGFFLKDELSLK